MAHKSSDPNQDYWNDKRVLVTGGAGFLGSHLVRRLGSLGVTDLVIPRSSQHDLRQGATMNQLLGDTSPDVVFHLAAKVGGIGANQEFPGDFFYENMLMGAHMIHFSSRHKVKKLIMVGTVCSYPKFTAVPFREDSIWEGFPEETNAPYGIAKRALITQSEAYREQYRLNTINIIPVNLYGPGDNFYPGSSHVIPALIDRMIQAKNLSNHSVDIWGAGTATREFLYVDDAAKGLILAAEHYNLSEPVNLGAGREISIKDLANEIARATGYEGELVWDASKPEGQPRRVLDTTKAREEFGFVAETSFLVGLQQVVAWYRKEMKKR